MKKFLLGLIMAGMPIISWTQNTIIEESFESTCEVPWESFESGCHENWISISGTPDTKSDFVKVEAFEGDKYAKVYLWDKGENCSEELRDRGEGIALNQEFKKGSRYELSFAIHGFAPKIQWILTDGLQEQIGKAINCAPGELIPEIPAGSQVWYETLNGEKLEEWLIVENLLIVPEHDFTQLWFRVSSDDTKTLEKETANVFLDAVRVTELCAVWEDLVEAQNLVSCAEDGNSAQLILENRGDLIWEYQDQKVEKRSGSQATFIMDDLNPGYHHFSISHEDCEVEKTIAIEDCDGLVPMNKDAGNQGIKPTVFPNPTTGKVYIEMKAPGALQLEIQIFDSNGALVKTIDSKEYENGNFKSEFDFTDVLTSGSYILQFITNHGDFVEKLLVLED